MIPKLVNPRFLPVAFLLVCTAWFVSSPQSQAHASDNTHHSPHGDIWLIPIPAPAFPVAQFEMPLSRYAAGHRGIDYSVTIDEPLTAPHDGTIAFAGWVADKPVVAIQHENGFRTAFEPACTDLPVGTPVITGQPFGKVCPSINYTSHCQPWFCLHFSLRHNGLYLSPLALIGGLSPSHTVE